MINKIPFKSIRFQWIGFAVLISIIPLVILQLAYFTLSKNRVIKIAKREAQQEVQQIQSIADKKIEAEKEGLLVLYDFLKAQPSMSSLVSFKYNIAKYFFTYRDLYSRISILTPEGKQQVSFVSNFNPEYLYEQKWEERTDLKGLPSDEVKEFSKKITSLGFFPSIYGYSERLILSLKDQGLILADLRLKAVFKDALEQANISHGDDVFVFDQKGTVLWGTKPEWNNQTVEVVSTERKYKEIESNGGPFVLSFSAAQGPFSIGFFMHYGSLLDTLYKTLYWGLWVTAFFAGIIIFAIWFFTSRLKQSFVPLIQGTKEIAKGNLDYRVSRSSFKELNLLSHHFNEMTKRLKSVLEAMAQQKQMAMLGEFSSFVVHDLKSPLGAMELLAENLDEEIQESPLSGNLSKYTRDLNMGIQRLEHFVEKILDFVKPVVINTKKIDINNFLEQVAREIKIPIELDLDVTLPLISIDKDQFKRVIINLVDNANDAIQDIDDGKICVKTFSEGNCVFIDIKDNGIGIQADELSTVFDLFYTTKPRVGGHGFGLTIVKRIVQAHRGEIIVQSEYHQGTTFTIKLPIEEQA